MSIKSRSDAISQQSFKVCYRFPKRLIALCLFALISLIISSAVAQARPLNVLWIMADDLRPQMGCYGDQTVKTPHLDQLVQRSLRFDLAYVQSAICSPSRNSMFSGLRPNTTGLRGFGTRIRDVRPNIVTLPQWFKQHGYESRGFGKIFHIYVESMLGSEDDPQSWSAPLQLPTVPVWGPEQNALRNRLIEQAREAGKEFKHPHDWPRARTWDDSDVPDQQMQDGEITQMAIDYLQQRTAESPQFFLAVGFVRPHLPFNAPRKYWDLYNPDSIPLPELIHLPQNAPQWSVNQSMVKNYYQMPPPEKQTAQFKKKYLQAYFACISYVDACVGHLLNALQQSGQQENTIIVFLGDHGYQMGEYNSWGHKHSNFEISTRAPLIVHQPGMQAAGKATQQIVEFLDLYPTVSELAGLKVPDHLEGESFAKLLDNPEAEHTGRAVSEMKRRQFLGRSLRTAEFRYTEWRNSQGKLVTRELYDHQQDEQPGQLELVNVADAEAYQAVISELQQELHEIAPHRVKTDNGE